MFAIAPVMVGDWKQHELWDGTYIIDDLLDWHEMAMVREENKRRHQDYLENMRERS